MDCTLKSVDRGPAHRPETGFLFERAKRVRPSDRVRAFGPECVLRDWLNEICSELDYRLSCPIERVEQDGYRDMTVLGGPCYRIDEHRHQIIAGKLGPNGFEPTNAVVELLRPLAKPMFLRHIIGSLPQPFDERRPDLFVDVEARTEIAYWLTHATYRLLRDDARFRRLRRHDLPRAFALDPVLVQISLRCRQVPWTQGLSSAQFARVWQREDDYRRVATAAPQLLSLFDLLIQRKRGALNNGPLGTLCETLSEAGVKPATWRLLTRHGARLLAPVWRLAPEDRAWTAAIDFLLHMQKSGLPALPPPTVLSAWYALYGYRAGATGLGYQEGLSLNHSVLRAAFIEANLRRTQTGLDEFVDQFIRVASWSNAVKPKLDLHQRRAGWEHLQKRAEGWWASLKTDKTSRKRWRIRVRELRLGALRAVAITSGFELLCQGQQMRNCAGDYAADCESGLLRMYAIYRDGRARPVAHVGLRRGAGSRTWKVWQVKGRANSDTNRECARMAAAIAAAQQRKGQKLQKPEV